ncbi:DUF3037 domain-containing protein [Actinomycetospora straminea]|uniref:DUF3037 domain-containing protein n=1 Tax=Actinomycetospora straminea TaxID=663607 RepID=A0ABP9ERK1_9PSEU|nr:DUF3037 domain-containing protein [Actinomycetospora straminea]MDD7931559.1 DUF3037 domain-containing protein [Actinomycetospora straminea]
MSAAGTRDTFEYALLRVVPDIERGELVNVGVLLYCRHREHLAVRTDLDPDRVRALAPHADLDAVRDAVAAWERAVRGEGPAAVLSAGERFRWLTAPRSTVLQPGPVHTGLTADPEAEIDRLVARLVRAPS